MSEFEKKDGEKQSQKDFFDNFATSKMDSFDQSFPREEEQAQIASMRDMLHAELGAEPLASQEENTCDHKLVRFLRGYEHNEEAAVKAYREYLSLNITRRPRSRLTESTYHFERSLVSIRRERCSWERDITYIPTSGQSMRRFVSSSPRV